MTTIIILTQLLQAQNNYTWIIFVMILAACFILPMMRMRHKKNNQKNTGAYTCPMHPEVQSDVPGNCPKCGMALVKK
ncbi:heavy metal-binding domain-containing protein [Flavobacterium sp. ZT3R17]|uniref:heavy metal-binding domain-containing protein n=1 Tax=Flavobacterium cryoconiti TaxID=3398736 RepID=UPI003A853C34